MIRKLFHGLVFVLFIVMVFVPGSAWAEKGYDIVQNQKNSDKGFKDESAVGKMILMNVRGKKVVREFRYELLEETSQEGAKVLYKILSPADLKGVGLLSHQHKNREDDQWLYLPALNKTRRITGGGKGGRFIGSNFTYEDLGHHEIDDYSYLWLRTEKWDNASCDVVQITPKKIKSAYSKTIAWIRKSDNQTVRTDLYNKKGVLIKRALFSNFKLYRGKFWRSHKIVMKDLKKKSETELVFKKINLKTGLTAEHFSKVVLER